MFARVNFQTQVTSIMEILCRTAAEEIGKLLDDRCAVLHVELRRYQDENEALKMKVRAMARELHAADESGSCHSGNAREKEERNSLFSEGVDTIDAPKERDALGQESKDIDEESPESLFIKEEHPEEENSDPQGGLKTIEDSAAVSPGKNPLQPGPAAPSQHEACEEEHSMQVMSAANQEHNLTQDWSGCNDVEPRGRKLVAKTEQKEEIIVRRRSRFRVKPSISPGFASIKDSIKEKAWPLCTETDCEGEADEPDKCFAVGQYSHTFTEDQDSTKRAGSRSTLTSQEYCDVKTDVDTLNSDAVNEPGRLNAETQHSTKREDLSMQSRQRTDSAAEAESRPANAFVLCGKRASAAKRAEVLRKFTDKEKQFLCAQCGKHFTRCSHLIIHQRCHTGEKPFSCLQCGKHFSLRCNLITHQRIHTGEKPFSCVRCGTCFAQKSSLKTHERIHTGEKPFHCTQCGKRFAQSSSLRTHQRIHSRT